MRRAACSLLALYIACFGVVVHGHNPEANEATNNALQNAGHCWQRKEFAQGNYTSEVQTADATKSAAETHAAAERMKLVAGAKATYNASMDSMR